ncbi:MAG: hypothetical protein JNJ92_10110 [Altererythrobacter sp.]|nr:hypothetical protein [Altererythrobacter sp.]
MTMLAGGGVAAQSALAVSYSVSAAAMEERLQASSGGDRHGSVIFTGPVMAPPRIAAR